jgi:hypothetical protein
MARKLESGTGERWSNRDETITRRGEIAQSLSVHQERNHQGLGNRLDLSDLALETSGAIRRRERLNGMLNYYYRVAA